MSAVSHKEIGGHRCPVCGTVNVSSSCYTCLHPKDPIPKERLQEKRRAPAVASGKGLVFPKRLGQHYSKRSK